MTTGAIKSIFNLSVVRQDEVECRALSKIVHQNITQQVIAYMKSNIESGNWKVGEKIPSENELTGELGVSPFQHPSGQSAISAGIGVLESVHGKGTFLIDDEVEEQSNANKITAEDCRNAEKVLEFRRIVESEACYLATLNKSPELVKKLRKYLKIRSKAARTSRNS